VLISLTNIQTCFIRNYLTSSVLGMKVQVVRTLVSGLGFMMGVVGIWGDGA